MLSFRRSLLVALVLLSFFLLLRHHHQSARPIKYKDSPKPTGAYLDNKPSADFLIHHDDASKSASPKAASKWTSENNGRTLLTQKPLAHYSQQEMQLQPLRQQLAQAYPYNPARKFPAYIWQTWKTSPSSGEFSDALRTSEASWTELHPNFVHEVVTDDMAPSLVRHLYAGIPEVYEAYMALPMPVMKADFFRYLILLARGGIYSDIDTTALKSAAEWIPAELPQSKYGLVIGIEADPDRPDWQDWYSRRVQFCQWTIQAKPGHPVLVDTVAAIVEETLRLHRANQLKNKKYKELKIIEFTGPALWTDTVLKFFNDPEYFDMSTSKGNITWRQFTGMTEAKLVGDVVVLPITSFSPGVGQMGAGEIEDEMAFVHHAFEGSWKPEEERHIGEQPADS